MPILIVISPKLAVQEYALEGTLSIGRHEGNRIQLAEEKASRIHCRVRLDRDQAVIEDLDSANGVFVNGLRTRFQVLNHNDRITIGGTTIIYCEDNSSEKVDGTKRLMESISSSVNAIIPDDFRIAGKATVKSAGNNLAGPAMESAMKEPARPAVRKARRRHDHHYGAIVLLVCVCVCAAGAGYVLTRSSPQAAADGDDERRAAARAKEKSASREPAVYKAPVEPAPGDPAPSKPDVPRVSLDEQLKAVLAVRDRALQSRNFLGAKAALQSFLIGLNPDELESEPARKARRELDDTTAIVSGALDLILAQAREAFKAGQFRIVSQSCTSLISNDPNGRVGTDAREMLEQIDERTAEIAGRAKTKALDAIARGQLAEARAALDAVVAPITGTRWAGDIDALNLHLLVAINFLDEMEAARKKKAAAGIPIQIVSVSKKIAGTLAGLSGLTARIQSGQAELKVSLRNVETKDLFGTLDALELSNRYGELSCLWEILGRADDARAAADNALKHPAHTQLDSSLAGLRSDSENVHLYDFNGWRQQTDWEAVSGSWLTQDGKYVLETADGGETFLKPEKIGGAFPLAKARIGFDFEIRTPEAGWFFICEFGNQQQAAEMVFTAQELTLRDKSGEKKAVIAFNVDGKNSPPSARVDLAIDGDIATLQIDGQPAATVNVPGLSKLSGTLAFQARQCACAIDNVVVRTQK